MLQVQVLDCNRAAASCRSYACLHTVVVLGDGQHDDHNGGGCCLQRAAATRSSAVANFGQWESRVFLLCGLRSSTFSLPRVGGLFVMAGPSRGHAIFGLVAQFLFRGRRCSVRLPGFSRRPPILLAQGLPLRTDEHGDLAASRRVLGRGHHLNGGRASQVRRCLYTRDPRARTWQRRQHVLRGLVVDLSVDAALHGGQQLLFSGPRLLVRVWIWRPRHGSSLVDGGRMRYGHVHHATASLQLTDTTIGVQRLGRMLPGGRCPAKCGLMRRRGGISSPGCRPCVCTSRFVACVLLYAVLLSMV